jgi:peptide deformylase
MDDMLETMYVAPGVGLAAPQVSVHKRVIVVDTSRGDTDRSPIQMADPELIEFSDDLAVYDEGCLSFPDQYAEVERPAKVRVRYLDYENEIQEIEAEGLLSTCIQHEMDHLDGKLFVDHISMLKRNIILRKCPSLRKPRHCRSAYGKHAPCLYGHARDSGARPFGTHRGWVRNCLCLQSTAKTIRARSSSNTHTGPSIFRRAGHSCSDAG